MSVSVTIFMLTSHIDHKKGGGEGGNCSLTFGLHLCTPLQATTFYGKENKFTCAEKADKTNPVELVFGLEVGGPETY